MMRFTVQDDKKCMYCQEPIIGRVKSPQIFYCFKCQAKRGSAKAVSVTTAMRTDGIIGPASDHKCVDCGNGAYCYDHRDYSNPFAIEPVCRSCNYKRGGAKNFFIETVTYWRRRAKQLKKADPNWTPILPARA